MSRIIPSTSLFFDAFTGDAGDGVNYLNGNIIARIKRVTNVEFAWDLKNISAIFVAADKTISLPNQFDNRNFITGEFKVSDTFTITGTISNDGDYTISEISANGRIVITVESLVNEKIGNANFYGTTPITAIDYYYNLVPNNSPEDYTSIVDPFSKQKFTISGVDCTDPMPMPFAIGTKSYAWVTEKITDVDAGTTNAVFIEGMGLSDYVQSFRITQYFTITPFYLVSQFDNFQNRIAPDYYFNGNSLKYICRVDAKYLSGNPIADHSVSDLGINGTGSWYDEAALGSLGEYSIGSISYQDNDTANPLERLDITKNCLVTISVNSRNGKFVDTGSDTDSTMFILGFNAQLSDETEYQNTSTTQRDNFFQDSCTNFIGAASENGMQFGTGYQSITECQGAFVSASVFTVTFIFSAGNNLKSFWQSKENGDRYYAINLITQGVEYNTTKITDCMTLLCDWQSTDYETKKTDLFSFTGTGIESFIYPDISEQPRGSIEGFQGDAVYNKIGFKIPQHLGQPDTCTVQKITWEAVGEKTDRNDFVFEQKIIDFSQAKKLLSVQQLIYSDTRGLISYIGDPCNEVVAMRDEANDTETESAFVASYGLILRYENWIDALNQFQFTGTEIGIADIAKDISIITQDWTDYNDIESWNLFLRFSITINSLENNSINTYQTQIPINAYSSDQIIWWGATGLLTQDLQYFNEYETEELEAIVANGITLIRYTMNGDFPLPVGDQYYGQMFATIKDGNIFGRRLASSEIPSESDSPFSPTPTNEDADFSWAYGNCRINIFADSKITLESFFDSTLFGQNAIDIRARIGSFKTVLSS